MRVLKVLQPIVRGVESAEIIKYLWFRGSFVCIIWNHIWPKFWQERMTTAPSYIFEPKATGKVASAQGKWRLHEKAGSVSVCTQNEHRKQELSLTCLADDIFLHGFSSLWHIDKFYYTDHRLHNSSVATCWPHNYPAVAAYLPVIAKLVVYGTSESFQPCWVWKIEPLPAAGEILRQETSHH